MTGMQLCAGLTAPELDAMAELEQRTIAADGGRLKLEWATLNRRSGEQVDDLLWWDDTQLAGFLGLYSFGGAEVELAGMVAPTARRQGIATALLDAAMPLLAQRGHEHALLVCPRTTDAGRALAQRRGAPLAHSEHSMVLTGAPSPAPADPATSIRSATPGDSADVERLLVQGFGPRGHPPDLRQATVDEDGQHLIVERDGRSIGYLRITHHKSLDGVSGGVYGFVIDEALRGRGIGRDVLHRACELLRGKGANRIGLEVAVENDRALNLYTSVGFSRVITEDYFRLSVDRPPADGRATPPSGQPPG
jgi:ribosomal protein S18 acetylase RimI-like enzyme